jgi:hypothetical protein
VTWNEVWLGLVVELTVVGVAVAIVVGATSVANRNATKDEHVKTQCIQNGGSTLNTSAGVACIHEGVR